MELTWEPVVVLMGQAAIKEYGNGIMCFQTLLHILSILWVFDFDSWPAKPLEFGRLGQPREGSDKATARKGWLKDTVNLFHGQWKAIWDDD